MKNRYPRACLAAILISLSASAADVVLVQATTSAPNDAERNYGARLTTHLESWLTEAGIELRRLTDDTLSADTLAQAKIAILGYNPHLPAPEILALRQFVYGGGKLIVFYSSDPRLAQLMGMKLGDYQAAPLGEPWTAVQMTDREWAFMPERFGQTSRNIRPVHPVAERSRVLAYWERDGKRTPDPALLASDAGYWMTHVLLPDQDLVKKRQFLLALIGSLDPASWRGAAEHAVREAGAIGRYASLAESAAAILTRARGLPDEADILRQVERATTAQALAAQHLRAGRYVESLEAAATIRTTLLDAYARTWPPRPNEVRGVWDHSGLGLHPGDWMRTCRELKARGITDLFTNLMWPGQARYKSDVVPESRLVERFGDQAEQACKAARAAGIRLHAWKVCWRMDGAPDALLKELRQAGRLQVDRDGHTVNWLCPTHTDNLRYEKDAIREVVRKYPLDGIHLDYIRYRDSGVCYCPTCRAAFEASRSHRVRSWPADVIKGKHVQEFRQWRAAQITRLVRDVGVLARRLRPDIRVSAAVYGRYPLCVDSVGQDWGDWLREGYVDFVCPMNYTESLSDFVRYTHAQLQIDGAAGHVLPGIGATAAESRLDAASVLEQIGATRVAGMPGFMLYELNPVLADEILPYLSRGATRQSQ